MGPPDTGFQHATGPEGYTALSAYLFDAVGLAMAANTSKFDVNDPARAKFDGMLCIRKRAHRFIQTDGRFDLFLQLGMIEHIIVRQGLLDHHQFEFVERFEKPYIRQRVSRISIAHQKNFRKAFPHASDNLKVPAGFDLNLYPLVTVGKLLFDLFK